MVKKEKFRGYINIYIYLYGEGLHWILKEWSVNVHLDGASEQREDGEVGHAYV
jgi:hypothetical protein